MVCGGTAPANVLDPETMAQAEAQKAINKSINQIIRSSRESAQSKTKMLLLGAGESGKSTIFKQMQIINGTGYMKEELTSFKWIIHRNVLDAIQILITQASSMGIQLEEANEGELFAARFLHVPSLALLRLSSPLNKRDLFEEKVKTIDPRRWFPDYTGGCDKDKCEAFFRAKFKERMQRAKNKSPLYVHTTCATDTGNIRFVLDGIFKDEFIEMGISAKKLEGLSFASPDL